MSRKRLWLLAAAALALVVPAALATAAATRVHDDAINACVKKDGKLRVVGSAGACPQERGVAELERSRARQARQARRGQPVPRARPDRLGLPERRDRPARPARQAQQVRPGLRGRPGPA
jgi:hypothetical protein